MKRIITASLVATLALTGAQAASNAQLSAQLNELETQLAKVKKDLKKQKKTLNKVKAHDAGDNIKWGADLRTSIDNIDYDMADGSSKGKSDLMSMRLWLNMAYAPDQHNVFKGQLSMNKAFGADFGTSTGDYRAFSMGSLFDWTGNEALADNSLRVRQAYWLYLGDKAFGADIPWTFSLGRRPSAKGFLANLRDDDAPQSPLAHVINVEFDGLSSKLDLSSVTGIPGMSIKLCAGQGSTNADPLFVTATPYANDDNALEDISLAGFIFEPYNDGQYIVKATWFKAFDLPGMDVAPTDNLGAAFPDDATAGTTNVYMTPSGFNQYGDMQGAAFSVLVDGLTEDGYFADAKVFGSIAWSKTEPDANNAMLGSTDSETGTSYWVGAQLPVTVADENYGVVGLEFNHGSQYWRPFTYSEDTMIGSKIAARGDAWEAYYTYQINDALSAQLRYTSIDYDYAGSNGFFGNYSGMATKIDDLKAGAAGWDAMSGGGDPTDLATIGGVIGGLGGDPTDPTDPITQQVMGAAGAAQFLPNIVEAATDFRFYLRYRF